MSQQAQNRLFIVFEIIALCLVCTFWVCYGTFSFYNRIATDDYSMIALANHRGILSGTIWFYFNWTGGVFCTLFQTISVALTQGHKSLLLYNVFLLAFLSSSSFFFFNQFSKKHGLQISRIQNFIISQLFVQALFFSGLSISENWFWVVGSTAYLYPICLVFVSISFFLRFQRLNNYTDLVLSLLFAFFIGSYPLNYAATYAAITSLILGYRLLQTRKISFSETSYLVVLVSGVVLNLASPGNWKRMAATALSQKNAPPKPSFAHEITTVPLLILKKLLLTKLFYVLIFCLPIAYLLTEVSGARKSLSLRNTIWLSGFFIMSILLNVVIMYKALGWGMGSYRSMLHLNLVFILLIISISWLIAGSFSISYYLKSGVLLCLLAGLYLNLRILYIQLPIIKNYSRAHDNRDNLILNAKSSYKGSILYLDSLPNSGILLTAEMGADTSNYINVDMKSRFDLPFALAVKSAKTHE